MRTDANSPEYLANESTLVNAKVDEAMKNDGSAIRPIGSTNGLMKTVLEYDAETVAIALGTTGEHIRAFAAVADLEHPDVETIAANALGSNTSLTLTATELLDIAKYSREKGHRLIAEYLPKIFKDVDVYDFVTLRITDPNKKSCSLVRFVKDQNHRLAMRQRRGCQETNLFSFYKDQSDSWDNYPTSFAGFVRNEIPFGEEITKIQRKVEHLAKMGLVAMAQRPKERLDTFQSASRDRYYGFNRCAISTAAVVLARVHGFEMTTMNGTTRIRGTNAMKSQFESLNGKDIPTNGMAYHPRIYSTTSMPVTPERMQKLLAHLESFPDVAGKPLFDHYSVLVPTFTRFRPDGAVPTVNGSPLNEIQLSDMKMIEEKMVIPVLLGEADGKLYFIDYWT
jgi:hypothetical protein